GWRRRGARARGRGCQPGVGDLDRQRDDDVGRLDPRLEELQVREAGCRTSQYRQQGVARSAEVVAETLQARVDLVTGELPYQRHAAAAARILEARVDDPQAQAAVGVDLRHEARVERALPVGGVLAAAEELCPDRRRSRRGEGQL